jgi:hypothetical protein
MAAHEGVVFGEFLSGRRERRRAVLTSFWHQVLATRFSFKAASKQAQHKHLHFLFTNAVFNLQVSYDYESWRLKTAL